MANSLRVKLKKLCHDGKIEQSELDMLLSKLDGHDKQIRNEVIDECIRITEECCYRDIYMLVDMFKELKGGVENE